jgi:DNA-binding transcriptional regulator YhcF (GntR family)
MTPVATTKKKDPRTWARTRHVAEEIIDRICAGVYPPGSKVPSTREIAAGAGDGQPMAVFTATGVSKLIQQSGLVATRRGLQPVVREPDQWPSAYLSRCRWWSR